MSDSLVINQADSQKSLKKRDYSPGLSPILRAVSEEEYNAWKAEQQAIDAKQRAADHTRFRLLRRAFRSITDDVYRNYKEANSQVENIKSSLLNISQQMRDWNKIKDNALASGDTAAAQRCKEQLNALSLQEDQLLEQTAAWQQKWRECPQITKWSE